MNTIQGKNVDTYPPRYVLASLREVAIMQDLVGQLGGVIGMLAFRVNEDNVDQFTGHAATKMGFQTALENVALQVMRAHILQKTTQEDYMGVVLYGPDPSQLSALADEAEERALSVETQATDVTNSITCHR